VGPVLESVQGWVKLEITAYSCGGAIAVAEIGQSLSVPLSPCSSGQSEIEESGEEPRGTRGSAVGMRRSDPVSAPLGGPQYCKAGMQVNSVVENPRATFNALHGANPG
jgi:hypothetical protein